MASNIARSGTRFVAALTFAAAVVAGTQAHASPGNSVTDTFNFNIGPFTGPAPVPGNWIGSFSLTFDPTTSTAASVSVNAFSSNVSALVTPWDYVVSTTSGPGHTVLVIGDDCPNNSCIDQTGSGFVANTGIIQLDLGATSSVLTTAPVVLDAEYTAGSGVSPVNPHWSASVNVLNSSTPVTVTASVPEPASIALMVTGLAALAGLRFRRAKAPA
jgi:hypothetical protein